MQPLYRSCVDPSHQDWNSPDSITKECFESIPEERPNDPVDAATSVWHHVPCFDNHLHDGSADVKDDAND